MAFNNFQSLILSHARAFSIITKSAGTRDSNTSRFKAGSESTSLNCRGVFETITEKDLKKYPDFELIHSEMKCTTTPQLMKKHTPTTKEKIIYNGVKYFIHKIVNKVHYGNYYILFFREEETRV